MAQAADMDRSQYVPRHSGDHILPNSPLFGSLIRHARRGRVALRDRGVEKTYAELLDAVLAFRKVVAASLSSDAHARLCRGDEVYIGVLGAGGFEFTVAILTVLALGAAAVPMFPTAPIEELVYFIDKTQQVAVLGSSAVKDTAKRAGKQVGNVTTIDILSNLPETPRFRALDMAMSSDPPQDDRAPGIVIFTSGTTARPKAVVHRRTYTYATATSIGEGYDIDHNDVLLHVLPVHHTTGLGTSFFPFLCAGACIEFRGGGGFDAKWVWDRFLQGGLTVFSAVPTIFMRLKWDFERRVSKLPPAEVARHVAAANNLRLLLCGSSALQDNVQQFWTELRAGTPILTRYGATEFPGCLKVPLDANHKLLPKGCVGLPVPGVELKLSEGNQGELLVKSPYMFAKYLHDPDATKNAHDEDGWFKTGDIAQRHGDLYTIVGRASVDVIKSGGYKISAVDIERECQSLPYVKEAMVVGVTDEEFGQRVGAVIAVTPSAASLTLERLRTDLRRSLASYKLPTILRVVEGELPKGVTGKVQKKVLGPELIPSPGYDRVPEVQVWRRSQREGHLHARL
ncbi:hypothetical protein LTS17_009421 [Exophiala oligosperma]